MAGDAYRGIPKSKRGHSGSSLFPPLQSVAKAAGLRASLRLPPGGRAGVASSAGQVWKAPQSVTLPLELSGGEGRKENSCIAPRSAFASPSRVRASSLQSERRLPAAPAEKALALRILHLSY